MFESWEKKKGVFEESSLSFISNIELKFSLLRRGGTHTMAIHFNGSWMAKSLNWL